MFAIKFYASSKSYSNKLFSFKVKSFKAAVELLEMFHKKGNYIKKFYYEDHSTGEVLESDEADIKVINENMKVDSQARGRYGQVSILLPEQRIINKKVELLLKDKKQSL